MKEWVWNLFFVIAALSFIEIVMPEGSIRTYLKFIFSLMILGVVVLPLSDLNDSDIHVMAPMSINDGISTLSVENNLLTKMNSVQTKQIREIYEEKTREKKSSAVTSEIQGISKPARDIYSNDEEEPN